MDLKTELLDLLDRQVFQPVINAPVDVYEGGDRERLRNAQDAARRERDRYMHECESADEVYARFRADLESEPDSKLHSDLVTLKLPTLRDIEDEVERRYRG